MPTLTVSVYVDVCAVLQGGPAVARAVAEDLRQVLGERGVPHHFGRERVFRRVRGEEFYVRLLPRTQEVCSRCFRTDSNM